VRELADHAAPPVTGGDRRVGSLEPVFGLRTRKK